MWSSSSSFCLRGEFEARPGAPRVPGPRPAANTRRSTGSDITGIKLGAPIMSLKKCHSVPTKGQLLSDIMALF